MNVFWGKRLSYVIKKITEMKGENSTLEVQLDETGRLLKLAQNKEKLLIEGKTLWGKKKKITRSLTF